MNSACNMPSAARTSRRERGFSLLEVLVAILVLSLGLLGLAQLQSVGIRSTHGAYLRTQATLLAGEMLDSMRANLTAARQGDYDLNFGDAAPTGTSIAANDVNAWLTKLDTTLPNPLFPNGRFQIKTSPNANPAVNTSDVTIAIRWTGNRQNEQSSSKTFTVDTTL